MSKEKLFLDYDSVIVDSVKAYTDTYNEIYRFSEGFIPANPKENKHWDFNIQCPLEKNPVHIFGHPMFFKLIKFMPNAEKVIKELWREIIQDLPDSFFQKRTWTGNYAVLRNMYFARRNHKQQEWRDFCKMIEELPYSELITIEK